MMNRSYILENMLPIILQSFWCYRPGPDLWINTVFSSAALYSGALSSRQCPFSVEIKVSIRYNKFCKPFLHLLERTLWIIHTFYNAVTVLYILVGRIIWKLGFRRIMQDEGQSIHAAAGLSNWFITVSYTHLDVYKRQLLKRVWERTIRRNLRRYWIFITSILWKN